MALSTHRSAEALADGITRWLDATRAVATLSSGAAISRPTGLSSETVLCEAKALGDGSSEAFVVRLPPVGEGPFPQYDLDLQAEAQRVAAAHGIPAPAPVELVEDESWLGSPFLVAPMVAGHVPSAMVLFDKWVTGGSIPQQRRLYDALIAQLAAIHRIRPDAIGPEVPRRDTETELAHWAVYLEWYADGEQLVPQLPTSLRRGASNIGPRTSRPRRCSGGTCVWATSSTTTERDAVAVLDWEMASVGAPEHDVAWWLTLEATQDELFGRRVDAFPTAARAPACYERQLGRPLEDMAWFEVFAMVRSTAVMTRVGLLHERAGHDALFPIANNPILPLISRASRLLHDLAIDIDPAVPGFFLRSDYYDVLRQLRAESPVHEVAPGMKVVSRYHDIREISRESGAVLFGQGTLVNDPLRAGGSIEGSILHMDPPQHAVWRRLLNRAFTPQGCRRDGRSDPGSDRSTPGCDSPGRGRRSGRQLQRAACPCW